MLTTQLKPKLKGVLVHHVQENELATNWQNDVPVLATPVLLWLAELACMRAVENLLEPGQMTLGYGHDIRHMAPTPLGWTITIEAELDQIENKKLLTFRVQGRDASEVILSGTHTRAVVDRARFLPRLKEKQGSDDANVW